MYRLSGAVALCLLVLSAHAGTVEASITRVSAGGWDLYYTVRTDSTYNPANCPNDPRYWFIEKSNEFADAILSIALTAYTSDKPVSAFIDDNACLNGYPKLRRLTIGGAW